MFFLAGGLGKGSCSWPLELSLFSWSSPGTWVPQFPFMLTKSGSKYTAHTSSPLLSDAILILRGEPPCPSQTLHSPHCDPASHEASEHCPGNTTNVSHLPVRWAPLSLLVWGIWERRIQLSAFLRTPPHGPRPQLSLYIINKPPGRGHPRGGWEKRACWRAQMDSSLLLEGIEKTQCVSEPCGERPQENRKAAVKCRSGAAGPRAPAFPSVHRLSACCLPSLCWGGRPSQVQISFLF